MQLIIPLFGTCRRGAVQTARGTAGAASCLSTVDPIGQVRYTQASMLLLF